MQHAARPAPRPARRPAALRCARLRTLDEAKALVDLVYDTYGLSFHREWMYHPEQMLELNRRGDITSFIALDGDRVVGHTGFVRPFFELQPEPGRPLTDPRVQEAGLSVVAPRLRGQGVQAELGAAMFGHAVDSGLRGVMMRCVTHHPWSQRSATRAGGLPVGLLLGCVPRWVRYDNDDHQGDQPLSSLLIFTPLQPEQGAAPLALPEGFGFVRAISAGAGLERAPAPRGDRAETALVCAWNGAKQLASVLVPEVGADLVERLEQTVSWLICGHIAHVTVYIAADDARLAEAGPALRAMGLFPAGWLPGFFAGGRDAVVLQAVAWQELDPALIAVEGEAAAQIKAEVVGGWAASRGGPPAAPPRHGAVIVHLDARRRARGL
jgi:serine/threonine-protein kinase RsbW